jgi:hypothetical protein
VDEDEGRLAAAMFDLLAEAGLPGQTEEVRQHNIAAYKEMGEPLTAIKEFAEYIWRNQLRLFQDLVELGPPSEMTELDQKILYAQYVEMIRTGEVIRQDLITLIEAFS